MYCYGNNANSSTYNTALFNDASGVAKVPYVWLQTTSADHDLGYTLTDGSDITDYYQLLIPQGFQELVSCVWIIVAGGTGNFRRSIATDTGNLFPDGSDEDYNTHTDAIAVGVVAVTTDKNTQLDISGALTDITNSDLVSLRCLREGNDAADTVGADCYSRGVLFRYV